MGTEVRWDERQPSPLFKNTAMPYVLKSTFSTKVNSTGKEYIHTLYFVKRIGPMIFSENEAEKATKYESRGEAIRNKRLLQLPKKFKATKI